MISLRLFPGGRAVDGTEIAARMVGHPLLQRLGVREAAVGLTVPDPLPLIGYDGNAASSGTSATSPSSVRKVESSPCAPANGARNSHHVTSAPYAAPAGGIRPSPKPSLGSLRKRPQDPDPFRPRCAGQLPVEGGERQSALLRKRQIDGVIGAEPMCDRDRQSEPEPAPSRGSWRTLAIAVAASAATIRPLRSAIVASAMKIALRNWRRAARPRHFHP